MKKVWLYERRHTDRHGKKFGIVYLDSEFKKPALYLDAPYERYKTPAVTLLSGTMYRLTVSFDHRQHGKWQYEWLLQELRQRKRGEVRVKNIRSGIGLDSVPENLQESAKNAVRLAQHTDKWNKPYNLGQPTRLTPPNIDNKPKRKKTSTTSKKKPQVVNKSAIAKKFGFKVAQNA